MRYYYLKRHKGIFYYLQHSQRKYGFRFTYYDTQHKRHEHSERGFKAIKDAQVGLNEAQKRQKALKGSKSMTFAQWCHIFLAHLKVSANKITTYNNYVHLLNHDVIPYIGNIRLIDIKPMTYKFSCLTALLQRGLSRKTVIDVNGRVQSVMNSAVKNDYINKNQLKGVDVPDKNKRPKKEIMNDRQLKRFNKCLDKHSLQLKAIYYTLEYTGMRAGELLGLHWKDVDLSHRIINIRYTRDSYGLREPKTKHSVRTIPMRSVLAKLLSLYKRQCKRNYKITPRSYVILGKHGKPLIPNLIPSMLRRLLIECGLKKMVGRFTPHSFRHMLVSRLIDAGIKPIAVSKMMGHASVRITLDVYAQSAPGEILNIDKAFDKIKHN